MNKYQNEHINDLVRYIERIERQMKCYKQRIDKAIEYIGNYEEYCDEKKCYCTPKYFEHLLEILGDKEQEEYTLTKDEKYETYTLIEDEENGTKQINGEWYRVEKK